MKQSALFAEKKTVIDLNGAISFLGPPGDGKKRDPGNEIVNGSAGISIIS